MTKPDEKTRVKISPSVYARPFGDELVLLEFARGEYFALDAIGAFIWRGLEEGQAIGQIADAIALEHDVTREAAFRDIVDLVTHMRDEKLLTMADMD
jgi:hypothetical protein